ncbi:MAG: Mov34/MPN/PAD-1 family protein [Promethearchaeota archaeon]
MSVKLTSACYYEILKYTLNYANPQKKRREWKEVVGFLIGTISGSDVVITDVVMSTQGNLVYVVEEDYSKLPWNRFDQGEYLVGWVHSHPGHGLFLSEIDIDCQANYQKMHKKAVALVIDHTKVTSTFPGMEAFRVDDKGQSYAVSLQILGIPDFSQTYESLLAPLEAELSEVFIRLQIPSEVLPYSPFQVLVEYVCSPSTQDSQIPYSYGSPLVYLKYSLHTSNVVLLTTSWGGFFRHELNSFGTIAIIRLMSGKEGIGEVTLRDIQLGSKKDSLYLQDQRKQFNIQSV